MYVETLKKFRASSYAVSVVYILCGLIMLLNPNFVSDYTRDTKGIKNGRAKLTEEQVLQIIELLLSKKYSNVEIAKKFNVSPATISHIKSKDTWTYLTENITFN